MVVYRSSTFSIMIEGVYDGELFEGVRQGKGTLTWFVTYEPPYSQLDVHVSSNLNCYLNAYTAGATAISILAILRMVCATATEYLLKREVEFTVVLGRSL